MGELEEKLKEKLESGYEEQIGEKIAEFGGLLSKSAAIRLLCKQNNIETEKMLVLSEAKNSPLTFWFSAAVDRIYPVQEYGNGAGCSVRLHLSDKTGEATLVLWNEQVEQVKGEISIGDYIECRGAYFKGGEIGISRSGSIRAIKKLAITPVPMLTKGICNVKGTVKEVEPDYHYVDKKTGNEKSLSSFLLCEGKSCRRVVIWEFPEGTKKPDVGDVVLLEKVEFKNSEIQFNRGSRMVKKTKAGQEKGLLKMISIGDGGAAFHIGEKKYTASLLEALELMGIRKVPQGISEKTLILIKAQEIAGKSVKYKADGQRLAWLAVEK